jgi:hypothetical protein
MKQKDIALIIVIAVVSALVSFFVARIFFLKPQERSMKAEIVQPITTDFNRPDTKYFNASSVNPTQQIEIGNGSNAAPYNGAQ